MDAAQNLSNNLRTIRTLRQMSLVCFASELGISKSTLQEIERGHSPSLDTLECIAQHLEISAAALISDSPSPTQTGILFRLLQGLDWYRCWSAEDQAIFLSLATQLLHLLTKCSHPSFAPSTNPIP